MSTKYTSITSAEIFYRPSDSAIDQINTVLEAPVDPMNWRTYFKQSLNIYGVGEATRLAAASNAFDLSQAYVLLVTGDLLAPEEVKSALAADLVAALKSEHNL